MDKSSSSVTVLLFLMQLPFFGHALFEYICDQHQLYKPYIHVYRHRKGPRIVDLTPGFYDMSDYKNVYVCINGIAFLYFAKTTTVSEVFEAPRLKKYAHTCEMYNVQPREGSATVVEVTLRLRAILLIGDPIDYRLPHVQKFTAPYYFHKDQLNAHLENDTDYELQPAMYMNASSVVIIGQSECGLQKGRGRHSVIKVRPHVFPTEVATPEKKVEVNYFCKIGYMSLLEKASTPVGGPIPPEDVRSPALALIEDERVTPGKCIRFTPSSFHSNDVNNSFNQMTEEIKKIDEDIGQNKTYYLEKYNAGADPEIQELNEEKKKLVEKIKTNAKSKDIKKLERQLEKVEMKIKIETGKKTAFEKALNDVAAELTLLEKLKSEADPQGSKASAARKDREDYENAINAYTELESKQPAPLQTELDLKLLERETARRRARDSARDYEYAVSQMEVSVLRLKKMSEKVERTKVFIAAPKNPRIATRSTRRQVILNPYGSPSVVITAQEKECEKLPEVEGDEGECKKGKPDKTYTCLLFKSSLGIHDPWSVPSNDTKPTSTKKVDSERKDLWKREVLDLIGSIFSKACDKIRNVKKFATVTNRLMGFYLTNDYLFNMAPNPLTDTCVNYRFTAALKSGTGGTINMNFKEEKQFWTTLKFVLKECKMEGRRLSFKETSADPAHHSFVQTRGPNKSMVYEVLRHEEQADVEYSYNWPMDMNWKMFVTVMGVCMSGWETKIPLISSRFFALYTEDFLMPLRETWINPKDNIIFQFILSEFYNAHTEYWVDMCMEASFIYAGERDYRPPRSLMVNCHSEHNYFVNSKGVYGKNNG